MLDKAFNVVGAIVTLAIVATVVGSRNTSAVIRESGRAFAGSVRAAKGNA